MAHNRLQQKDEFAPAHDLGVWRRHEDRLVANDNAERTRCRPMRMAPVPRQESANTATVTREESAGPNTEREASAMTITEFVERVFVPEHVTTKNLSGRIHYQSILKHVITPETVDRVFRIEGAMASSRLKASADWPYLGNLPLRNTTPDDVQRLLSAASEQGYSTQTIKHIRSVISFLFAYAGKHGFFTGPNPAGGVTLPDMTRKDAHTLTLAQLRQVLGVMRHPEKEMALMTVVTSLNLAEICGLQWKYVNLTATPSSVDGEMLPARSIAIRKQWNLGELASVHRKSRQRNVPIPDSLLPVLLDLQSRRDFTGPDDFVLVSRSGKPVNGRAIAFRRLQRIGKDLQMPWLSWQVFQRTRASLLEERGIQLLDLISTQPASGLPGNHVTDAADAPVTQCNGPQDILPGTVAWTGSYWMQLAPVLRASFGTWG